MIIQFYFSWLNFASSGRSAEDFRVFEFSKAQFHIFVFATNFASGLFLSPKQFLISRIKGTFDLLEEIERSPR